MDNLRDNFGDSPAVTRLWGQPEITSDDVKPNFPLYFIGLQAVEKRQLEDYRANPTLKERFVGLCIESRRDTLVAAYREALGNRHRTVAKALTSVRVSPATISVLIRSSVVKALIGGESNGHLFDRERR